MYSQEMDRVCSTQFQVERTERINDTINIHHQQMYIALSVNSATNSLAAATVSVVLGTIAIKLFIGL